MTDLLDSHKVWKGKIIRIRSMGGFGLSLVWRLVDRSQNRFAEATEAEATFFTKV